MIVRLYGYFGVVGLASIIAWGGALGLLATQAMFGAFAPKRQRPRAYLIVLGLAVAGYILAQINSNRVSAVPLDSGGQPVVAQPVEELQSEAGVPAYLQMGKQRRDGGQAAPVTPAEQKPVRTYQESQLLEANQLDRWNLLITRGTLLLALLVLVADYLARFNHTTGNSYPLPIAGPWLDRLAPKSRTLLAGQLDLKDYLETAVRRGETFLYFSAPIHGRHRLCHGLASTGHWRNSFTANRPTLSFTSTPSGSTGIASSFLPATHWLSCRNSNYFWNGAPSPKPPRAKPCTWFGICRRHHRNHCYKT